MSAPYKVSTNTLQIQNPLAALAAILLGLSGTLTLLGLIALLISFKYKENLPGQIVSWVALGAASIYATFLFFDGLRARLGLNVPVPVPGPLGQSDRTLATILHHKAIPQPIKEPGNLHLLVQTIFPHCRALTPARHALVDALIHRFWPLLPAIGLIVLDAVMEWPIGWPIVILLLMVFAFVAHLAAVALLPADEQYATTAEAKIGPLTDAGHPDPLYHHNQSVLRHAEDSGFPNRILRDDYDASRNQGLRNFEAHIVFETQPMSLEADHRADTSARVLQGGAVLVGLFGWGLLFFLFTINDPAYLVLAALTGLTGVVLCEVLLRRAQRLLCCFRFRSDVFWIKLHGTFAESTVAMHPSGASSFSTSKQVAQSEIYLELRGARLITECSCVPVMGQAGIKGWRASATAVLRAARYPLRAIGHDEEFLARLRTLLQRMCSYSDQGRRLAVPDLTQRDLQDLIAVNISMGRSQAPPVLPVPVVTAGLPQAHVPSLPAPPPVALPAPQQAPQRHVAARPAPPPPPAPPPQRPPAPPPQRQPPQPRPPAPAAAPAVGHCPSCGFQATGIPGRRHCVVCGVNF